MMVADDIAPPGPGSSMLVNGLMWIGERLINYLWDSYMTPS